MKNHVHVLAVGALAFAENEVASLPRGKLATPSGAPYPQPMVQTNMPVTAGAFHDRSDELATLERLVNDLVAGTPRWLAIIGHRKVGKTS